MINIQMVLGRKGEMFPTPALEQKTKNAQKHFITSLHTSKADHRWIQINRPNYGKYFALIQSDSGTPVSAPCWHQLQQSLLSQN